MLWLIKQCNNARSGRGWVNCRSIVSGAGLRAVYRYQFILRLKMLDYSLAALAGRHRNEKILGEWGIGRVGWLVMIGLIVLARMRIPRFGRVSRSLIRAPSSVLPARRGECTPRDAIRTRGAYTQRRGRGRRRRRSRDKPLVLVHLCRSCYLRIFFLLASQLRFQLVPGKIRDGGLFCLLSSTLLYDSLS